MGKQRLARKRQNTSQNHVEFASENEFIDEINLEDKNEHHHPNFNKENHRK